MKKVWILLAGLYLVIFVQFSMVLAEDDSADQSLQLEEIVITGTKTKHRLEDVPVETILIPRQEIEQSNAQNISEIIASVPGFNFSQQSSTMSSMGYKNTVRGLNVESRYLLVLINGQRVFTGFRGGGMTRGGCSKNVNAIPLEAVERIEIVKGPGSALYGSDAVVGVMNIITKQPTEDAERVVGVEYGTYETKGRDYMGLEPVDTNRTTRKIYATVTQPVSESVGISMVVSHEENDGIHPTKYDISQNYLQGMVDFKISDSIMLRLGTELSDWEEKDDDTGDDKKETSNRIFTKVDYELSSSHNFRFQGYRQQMKQDFKDPTYGESDADVTYTDYEIQYTNRAITNNTLSLGFEALTETYDSSTVNNKQITTRSAYIQDELSVLDERLTIVPGVRVDNIDSYDKQTNPKLSIMAKPVDGTTLRLSAGRSFKTPSAAQSFGIPINHVTMWVYANPDLKSETSTSWQASFDQQFMGDKGIFSFTYYEMKIEDMIAQEMRGDYVGGLAVLTWKNINKAEIKGIESTLGIRLTDAINLDLNYTQTDAKDVETGDKLYDTPENTYGAKLNYADTNERFGGYLSYFRTGIQQNMVYSTTMSEETEPFSTVGANIWFKPVQFAKVTLQADNLLDEDLEGSDTIYTGRKYTAGLAFYF